ncbi:MAG: hypothetical protein FWF72_01390 [Paludibacter sp.]|nr:hypothetical protein [Paludibacter sp.]
MGKSKGTKKTGGRAKGTPNKITKQLRAEFEDFIAEVLPDLKTNWKNLDDETKWNILLKMSNFVIPKKQENEISFDNVLKFKESQEKINQLF